MVLPDDPPASPPPHLPPTSEFRSDPGAIQTLLWAVAACTFAAILLSFIQNRGIGEPTLFGYTSSNPFSGADPASGWVASLWRFLTPLAIVSIAVGVWHFLQGSRVTRTILKVLLTAWMIWTVAGVMSVSLMPSDRDSQYSDRHPGPNGMGGIGIEAEAPSVAWLLRFTMVGLGFCFVLGLISLRADSDADPSLRLSDSGPRSSDGSSRTIRLWRAPNSQTELDADTALDWSNFQLGRFFAMGLLIFAPVVLGMISEGLLLVGAFFVGMLTFPVWMVMGQMWNGLSDWQYLLFFGWTLLSLLFAAQHYQTPRGLTAAMLRFNQVIAILFAWAGEYALTQGAYDDSAIVLTLLSLVVALLQGALIATPIMRDDPQPRIALSIPNPAWVPSTPLDASYAAFCPDCGQQVHARNGNCLYCGGGVHAL